MKCPECDVDATRDGYCPVCLAAVTEACDEAEFARQSARTMAEILDKGVATQVVDP